MVVGRQRWMKDEEDDLTCTGHGVFVGVSR